MVAKTNKIIEGKSESGIGAGIALGGEGVVFVGGEHAKGDSDLLIAALEVETGEVRRSGARAVAIAAVCAVLTVVAKEWRRRG